MKRSLVSVGLAALVAVSCTLACSISQSQQQPKHKVLFLTHSAGFEHSVIHREKPDELSHSEKILKEICAKEGIEVTCTKDCSLLTAENLKNYDAVFLYTTGELPIPHPQDLLDYVHNGGALIGSHCATDTFHKWEQDGKKPYIEAIGAEFQTHGAQQEARVIVADPKSPTVSHIKGEDFRLMDEWYAFINMSSEIHPILILDTHGMKGRMYEREPYPISWTRNYGKGRVFYTAMGHREDVWTNPLFQQHVIAGMKWAMGDRDS